MSEQWIGPVGMPDPEHGWRRACCGADYDCICEDVPEMTEPDDGAVVRTELVPDTACPACGRRTLRIEWRLEAKPVGSYSLAGMQLKVSAIEWPWLVCGSCGVESKGKVE